MSSDPSIDQVLRAAHGDVPLRFPAAGQPVIAERAAAFDSKNERSWRQFFWGGDAAARDVVAEHRERIDRARAQLRGTPDTPPPAALVRAVMYVENNYNGGSLPWDKTPLPMNINYALWARAFADYNAAHPQAPLTARSVRQNPEHNILAGMIVLSVIDRAIDPALTGPDRIAMVASLYGHTEITLRARGPIAYGAKVTEVMAQEEMTPTPHVAPPLMDVSPPAVHLSIRRPTGQIARQ